MQETVLEVFCMHNWREDLQECRVCGAKSKEDRVVIGYVEEIIREKR